MLATTGNIFGDVREEQYDYIAELPKYQTWVKEHLGLKVIEKQEDADKIIQKANDTFKEPLFDWLRKNGAEIYTLPDNAVWNKEENKWDY